MIREAICSAAVAVMLAPGLALSQSTTRLAVLDFVGEGPTERFATYSRTIAENLVFGFTKSRGVRVMERTRIAEALSELKLSASGAVTTESAVQLGRVLGAAGVVMGSYGLVGDEIVITTRYVDVATAEVGRSRRVAGRDLLPMVDLLAEQLTLDLTPLADERLEIVQRRRDRDAAARSMMKSSGVAAMGSLLLPIIGEGYVGGTSNVMRGLLYTAVGTGCIATGVMFDIGDDGLPFLLLGVGVHIVSAFDAGFAARRVNRSMREGARVSFRVNPATRTSNIGLSLNWP